MIDSGDAGRSLAASVRDAIDPVRDSALQILTVVMRGDASLDALLNRELAGDLSEADKHLLYTLCIGVFRWQAKLDWVLNGFYHGEYLKCLPQMKNALRLALFAIMHLPSEPAEDSIEFAAEYVQALKGAQSAETARGVLSHISHSIDHIRYPDKKEDLFRYASVVGSHPWWLAKRWVERFGPDEAMQLMVANNTTIPVTFRVNKLRIEVKAFLERLSERGIKYAPVAFNDTCIAIDTLPVYAHLSTFKKGLFSPYSTSCALAVALMDPQQYESTIVLCASTSGKVMHIAELMINSGKVMAVDKIDVRTAAIKREAARLGITTINAVNVDPLALDAPIADRVLVDATNSQIGAGSTRPVVKWKLSPDFLHNISGHQLALLMHGAQFVKPGGVLMYTTQSTEPEENEVVVSRFLAAMPRFRVDVPGKQIPREYVTKEGFVQTLPHRHGIEGSFAVRMVREK